MGASLAFDPETVFRVELDRHAPTGEASLREHAVAWHPARQCYILVADVVPLTNPNHPNTYDTELRLWASPDLCAWTHHGVVVPKGRPGLDVDGYGVASPAGMAGFDGRLVVPFSAPRTSTFGQRVNGTCRTIFHHGHDRCADAAMPALAQPPSVSSSSA